MKMIIGIIKRIQKEKKKEKAGVIDKENKKTKRNI